MKKLIYISLIGAMFLTACETIDDRESLGSLGTADQMTLSAEATETGGNVIILTNSTKGIGGAWHYFGSISHQLKDTIVVPFLGTVSVDYKATTSGGIITVPVQLPTIDHYTVEPDTMYGVLANYSAKTWVWDDGATYAWFKGGYGQTPGGTWWTRTYQQIVDETGTGADEFTFDLDGAANATLVTTSDFPGPGTHKGTYTFDMTDTYGENWSVGKLFLNGVTVPYGIDPENGNNPQYTYDILTATEDKLVLVANDNGATTGDWGTSWSYYFKVKE